MRIAEKNSSAMNKAGAACGCAALVYIAARVVFTWLAGMIIAARVPGASLANPAGFAPAQAALLKLFVNTFSLACPFLLLRFKALPRGFSFKVSRWAPVPRLFLLFWFSMLLGNSCAALLSHWEKASSRISLPPSGLALMLAFLAVCALPAVGEELLFRGLMQNWLMPFGALPALLGQAVLFSLLHGRVSSCAAALFGGLALGYCALRTGSLLPGILFHFYNNCLAFLSQYGSQFWDPAVEQLLTLLFLFLPAGILLIPAFSVKSHADVKALFKHSPHWLFRCPGWLCAVCILAVLCITETYL